jgi:hypothetical protein
MDLNAIKAKLDTLNSNGQQKEKTDYSKIFWKPELGKQPSGIFLHRSGILIP